MNIKIQLCIKYLCIYIFLINDVRNLGCEGCILNIYIDETKNNDNNCSSVDIKLNVNVRESNITIKKDFFTVFHNLKTLQIKSEYYFEIDNKPFVINSNLEWFQCQCGLQEIVNETFTRLLYLTYINIDNNNVTIINKKSIVMLKNLETFRMNKNLLFNFITDAAVLISESLTEYECEYCGIDKIYSKTFSRLPNIQTIKLNYNKIIQIDKNSFSNNDYITELYFIHNLLVTFQPDIKKLEKLKILCLSENRCNESIDYEHNKLFKKNYIEANLNCTIAKHESLCINNIKLEPERTTIANSAIINTTTISNDIEDITTIMNTTDNNNTTTNAIENPNTLTLKDTTTDDGVPINIFKSEIKPSPSIIQTLNVSVGISDAFIVSYLLLIIITQIFVIFIIWYSFKLLRSNGNEQFDYSSTILSDHPMYKTS